MATKALINSRGNKKPLNQNNITDIVSSNMMEVTKGMTDIIFKDDFFGRMRKNAQNIVKFKKKVEFFKEVITGVVEINEQLSKVKPKDLGSPLRILKQNLSVTGSIVKYITNNKKFNAKLAASNQELFISNMLVIKGVINYVSELNEALEGIAGSNPSRKAKRIIKTEMNIIGDIIEFVNGKNITIPKKQLNSLARISDATTILSQIITQITDGLLNNKISRSQLKRLEKISNIINSVIDLFDRVNSITSKKKLASLKTSQLIIDMQLHIIENVIFRVSSLRITKRRYNSAKKKLRRAEHLMVMIMGIMTISILAAVIAVPFMAAVVVLGVAMLGLMSLLWIVSKVVKLLDKGAIKGLLSIGLIVLALTALAYVMVKLIQVSKPVLKDIVSILLFEGAVALIVSGMLVLGALFTLLTPLYGFILPGLTLMIATISLLTLMALELSYISKLKLDKKVIIGNVDTILDTSKDIIQHLMEPMAVSFNKPTSKAGKLLRLILTPASGILNFIDTILAFGIVTMTFLSTSLIVLMGKELSKIGTLKIDKATITSNVNDIISIGDNIFNSLLGPSDNILKSDTKKRGWISKLFPKMAGLAEVISMFGRLANAFIVTGLLSSIAGRLNKIAGFKINKNAPKNAQLIIDSAYSIIDAIKDNAIEKRKIKDVKANAEYIKDITRKLLKSAKDIEKLSKIKINNATGLNVVDLSTEIISKINTLDPLDYNKAKKSSEYIKDILNNISQRSFRKMGSSNVGPVIDKGITFFKTIDKIKIDKLQTTTTLFEKMSKLSESINGNFDGLAQALNDKIAPLLEKLKDLIQEIKDGGNININTTSTPQLSTSSSTNSSNNINMNELSDTMNRQSTENIDNVLDKIDNLISSLHDASDPVIIKNIES